jgi:NTP pyrophosphatase (non-canonical NTP hydrolase)
VEVKTSDLKKAAENASTVDLANVDSEKQERIDELVKELSTDPDDWSAFPVLLSLTNDPSYNRLKLCEELTELTEVLLKYNNKAEAYKPEDSKIIEEMGDVILRWFVLVFQMDVEDEIAARVEGKCKKLFKHYVDGKFKGGL